MRFRNSGFVVSFGMMFVLLTACGGGTQAPAVDDGTTAADDAADQGQDMAAEEGAATTEPTLEEREAAVAERERQVAQREAAASKPQTTTQTPSRPAATASKPAQPTEPQVERVSLTVPSGTPFDVEILDPVSSETNVVGDRFGARVTNDMLVDGRVAVPAGSTVYGSVTQVTSAKKIGGQAVLAVEFDTLELPSGESTEFHASLAQAGQKQTKKDAATIGGATAGGALLGRLVDKKHGTKGTLIGAVVGAAVGTAIASQNEGDPVTLDPGAVIGLTLEAPVYVVLEDGRPAFDTVASR